MPLTTDQCLDSVSRHSAGLAAAARANLTEPVAHCPGWTVADLVVDPPKITASSAGLLLWLYRRIDLAFDSPPELVERFRALCATA